MDRDMMKYTPVAHQTYVFWLCVLWCVFCGGDLSAPFWRLQLKIFRDDKEIIDKQLAEKDGIFDAVR